MKGIKHIVTGSDFVGIEFTNKAHKGVIYFNGDRFTATKPFDVSIPYATDSTIGGIRISVDSGTGRVDFYTQD